jgi:hypothetical protein
VDTVRGDSFVVLPLEPSQQLELAPLLKEAWNRSRCIIGDILPGPTGTQMRFTTVSRKAWEKIRKVLDAEAPPARQDGQGDLARMDGTM